MFSLLEHYMVQKNSVSVTHKVTGWQQGLAREQYELGANHS